jgi:hypothetical protein
MLVIFGNGPKPSNSAAVFGRPWKVENQPMKPIKTNPNEEKCPACGGTGFPPVKQPAAGRRIYPPPCKTCGGKGRMTEAAE